MVITINDTFMVTMMMALYKIKVWNHDLSPETVLSLLSLSHSLMYVNNTQDKHHILARWKKWFKTTARYSLQ